MDLKKVVIIIKNKFVTLLCCGLTVDLAERESVDDHPEVIEERQGDNHVPVVAELARGIEHERPPYALNAVRRSVTVLSGPAVLLSATVEAYGTACVVIRRPADHISGSDADRPTATNTAGRPRRHRCRDTGTISAHGAVPVSATIP